MADLKGLLDLLKGKRTKDKNMSEMINKGKVEGPEQIEDFSEVSNLLKGVDESSNSSKEVEQYEGLSDLLKGKNPLILPKNRSEERTTSPIKKTNDDSGKYPSPGLLDLLYGGNLTKGKPAIKSLGMSEMGQDQLDSIGEGVDKQELKQDVVNKQLNKNVASANASDPSMKKDTKTPLESLMKEYLSGREEHEKRLKEARSSDKKFSASAELAQALAGLGQSSIQAREGAPIRKTKFAKPVFDTASEIEGDRAGKLRELLTAKKLQDMTKQDPLAELKKQKLQAEIAKLNRKPTDANKGSIYKKAKMTAFGKGAAEFYQSTRPQLLANVPKIDKALKIMEDNLDLTGSVTNKLIGDTFLKFRDEEAYNAQQNMQSAITDTLRPTLGAQFTEKEGERIMNLTFDPAVSTKENTRRAIALKKVIANKIKFGDDFYKHLEQYGNDEGFDYSAYGMTKDLNSEASPEKNIVDTSPNGEIVERNGKTYRWNSTKKKYQLYNR